MNMVGFIAWRLRDGKVFFATATGRSLRITPF
jgi:hypothetical protein